MSCHATERRARVPPARVRRAPWSARARGAPVELEGEFLCVRETNVLTFGFARNRDWENLRTLRSSTEPVRACNPIGELLCAHVQRKRLHGLARRLLGARCDDEFEGLHVLRLGANRRTALIHDVGAQAIFCASRANRLARMQGLMVVHESAAKLRTDGVNDRIGSGHASAALRVDGGGVATRAIQELRRTAIGALVQVDEHCVPAGEPPSG